MTKANVTQKYSTVFEELKAKYGSPKKENDMRGKYLRTAETKQKLSKIVKAHLKENPMTGEAKIQRSVKLKGKVPWNKGQHLTEEDKLNKSLAHKGKIHSAEWNANATASQRTEEGREIRSKFQKELWANPEHKAKMIKATRQQRRPTRPEQRAETLLNYCLPNIYKYTGDGAVIINGKNPDFTNYNGQKKVVEIFGDYWHRNEDSLDRIRKYAAFGFACLVIWEHELSVIIWDREIELSLLTPLINKILEFENTDTHELLSKVVIGR